MDTPAKLMKWVAKTKGFKKPRRHPQTPPKIKPQEREYLRQLIPILKSMNEAVQHNLVRQLPAICQKFNELHPNRKTDAADDDIKEAMQLARVEVQQDFTPEQIKRIAEQRGISVAQLNKQFLDQGVKAVIGIDVFASEPFLQDAIGLFATANASLIESMQDEFLNKVENLAYSGVVDGMRAEDIADEIEGLLDPLNGSIRARAELIARDQIGKLNGQLAEARQTEIGVERYTWRTSGDERVRDDHKLLDGEVFDWDDPPITNFRGDRNHPGGDYQCRCWAEPVLADLVEGIDDEED